jgi:hypothetical protein
MVLLAKAHARDRLQALSKLGELVDGKYRIVSGAPRMGRRHGNL